MMVRKGDRPRILICAQAAGPKASGMGVYAHEMGRRLARSLVDAGAGVTVAVRAEAEATQAAVAEAGAELLLLEPRHRNPIKRVMSFSTTINSAAPGFDLLYSLDHRLPLKAIRDRKAFVTIHDCCYLEFDGEYPLPVRMFYKFEQARIAARCEKIITVSAAARDALIANLRLPAGKVEFAYNGIHRQTRVRDGHAVDVLRDRFGLRLPASYFLVIGNAPRKNFSLTLEAVRRLKHRGRIVHLVAVGVGWDDRRTVEAIDSAGLGDQIHRIGYVPHEAMPLLHEAATALLFPSICEGFGLPVADALAAGTPAVVADGGATAEVGGPYVLRIDPYNPDDMVTAILTLTGDGWSMPPGLEDHLGRFDWGVSADKLAGIAMAAVGQRKAA